MPAARAASPSNAKCILWHAPGQPPRPDLLGALNRPGFRAKKCQSAWSAFAHLTARTGEWATCPGEAAVLVLVNPDALPGVADLVDIVDRYNPASAVWMYDPAGKPQLRAVTAADLAAWRSGTGQPSTPQPVVPAPIRTSAPALRLAGEGPLASPSPARVAQAQRAPDPNPDVKVVPRTQREPSQGEPPASAAQPLLSDEELAMLLSEDAEK